MKNEENFDQMTTIISTLLNEIQKNTQNENPVHIITITSRPEILHEILLHPSILGVHISTQFPNAFIRYKLLCMIIKNQNQQDDSIKETLYELAKFDNTFGYSHSDLNYLCTQVLLRSMTLTKNSYASLDIKLFWEILPSITKSLYKSAIKVLREHWNNLSDIEFYKVLREYDEREYLKDAQNIK